MADKTRLRIVGFILFVIYFFDTKCVCSGGSLVCLDGKHHKTFPSLEHNLHQCKHWEELSCCSNDTAQQISIDGSQLYNFNYSHCSPISKQCMAWFIKNHCFYECSPYLGPWLIKATSSYRNEKFQNLPLCKADCDQWWEACKYEKTCVADWSKGFDWSNKGNSCPNGTTCKLFQHFFKNSTYFCENIYGPHDFKVTSQNNCMSLNFSGTNPNKEVVKAYISQRQAPAPDRKVEIPQYIPPSPVPPLQVHGTVVSIVIASIMVAICGTLLLFFGIKSLKRRRFLHQGVPVQFKGIVTLKKNTNVPTEAEMSFMRYDEDDDDDDVPELNGALKLNL